MNTQFIQSIGKILRTPIHVGWNGRTGANYFSARTGFDYRAEAGPLHENSIILACLKWEQRASVEAEICIQRKDENGKWQNDPRHRALDLLQNPNPHFSSSQLLDAIRWDYHLSGNAYVHKVRSAAGRVVQLWWIPSWLIQPRWTEDGAEFISCYEYEANGEPYVLLPEDVIHIRNGIDPRWQGRKGISDFYAVLREVCSDNEASVFLAAVLRNMGIPGVIISPKAVSGNDVGGGEMNKGMREKFRMMWHEYFGGENRGEPFIQSMPVDVTMPGWSPQQLVLDKVRAIPEQRIGGSFGIPLSVLQLGSGLQNSNSRANKGDDREQAYESCIIPTLYAIARELTRSLASEFGDPKRLRIWFDLSEVRCLQDDQNELTKRLVTACGGPFMTPNEARGAVGLAKLTGQSKLRNAANKPEDDDEKDTSEDDEELDTDA